MDDLNTATTVEVPEAAPAPIAPVIPTRDELKAKGWSAAELDSAEKREMIQPSGTKKEEPKVETKKEEAAPVKAGEPPAGERRKPQGGLPRVELTTEQEARLREIFPDGDGKMHPIPAFYWRAKNERLSRQAAEARVRELESIIEANKNPAPAPKKLVDENGNEVDPDDAPVTVKRLKELRAQEEEAQRKEHEELSKRAQSVTAAQKEQEEYARTVYPDFDETMVLAKEVMQKLPELVPDEADQEEIIDLIQQLQVKAANADKLGITSFNAARIAYKIGSFHPNKGKAPNGGKTDDVDGKAKDPNQKGNGTHTPEQMKRIEANTQRRASSASIPGGGGKRTIAVDDVGLAELNAMSFDQRQAFKDKHPDRYAKLLRG